MKYPRTHHIQGSLGKTEPTQVCLSSLPGEILVVEEKLDGTQVSLHFDTKQQIVFHSRGQALAKSPEFSQLKAWAYSHRDALWQCLGPQYVMFGEWVFAKHTVFYDALPHYFLEFDIWDQQDRCWLSTARRRERLKDSPVVSVPVLYEGPIQKVGPLSNLLQPSLYKTKAWRKKLHQASIRAGLDPAQVLQETDASDMPEGLYLKAETEDTTEARYKYIRPDFLRTILESESHWRTRQILPNELD